MSLSGGSCLGRGCLNHCCVWSIHSFEILLAIGSGCERMRHAVVAVTVPQLASGKEYFPWCIVRSDGGANYSTRVGRALTKSNVEADVGATKMLRPIVAMQFLFLIEFS